MTRKPTKPPQPQIPDAAYKLWQSVPEDYEKLDAVYRTKEEVQTLLVTAKFLAD